MIGHVVMWRLKEEALGRDRRANALIVKEMLESVRGKVPGLLRLEVGLDFAGSEASCDVVLVTEFTDRAALAAYAVHPAHVAVKDFLAGVRTGRWVVDYEK